MYKAGLFAVAMLAASNVAYAQDSGVSVLLNPEVYVAASIGYHNTKASSGGLNTVGPHRNSGDNRAGGVLASGAVGLANFASIGPVGFRLEAELFTGTEERLRTDSFPGPPGPITFFYTGTVVNRGGLVSLWADWQPVEAWPILVSLGAGGGYAVSEVNLTDGVVNANGSDGTGMYMVGGQVTWLLDENWALALTGRYVDYGNTSVPLTTVGAGAPAGAYTLDQSAFQALATVRLRFPI